MKQFRILLGVAALLVLAGGGAAYGLWRVSDRATMVIASKNFTESRLLAEIMAQIVERDAGLEVGRRDLGSTSLCHDALVNGAVDAYPEYSGTLLTEIMKQPPIGDPKACIARLRELLDEKSPLLMLDPFGLNDTYVLAMKKEVAASKGIAKISQLAAHPDLRAGFTAEFNQRPDGYPGLAKHYALKFSAAPVDLAPGHMYGAVAGGQIDVISAFSTDANIRKFNLVLLEDDQRFFPAYEAIPLLRREFAARYPKAIEALRQLAGKIDDATMLKLNYRVEIDGIPVKRVAREFLASLKK